MTGTGAVLGPISAQAGNSGRALAGQIGTDAAEADGDGGDIIGFEALFAQLLDCDAGSSAKALVVPSKGQMPAIANGGPPNKVAAGGASVAALALMRLNEAMAPVAAHIPVLVPAIEQGQTEPIADDTSATVEELEVLTQSDEAETADPMSQVPKTVATYWPLPTQQVVPTNHGDTDSGNEQLHGGSQPTTDAAPLAAESMPPQVLAHPTETGSVEVSVPQAVSAAVNTSAMVPVTATQALASIGAHVEKATETKGEIGGEEGFKSEDADAAPIESQVKTNSASLPTEATKRVTPAASAHSERSSHPAYHATSSDDAFTEAPVSNLTAAAAASASGEIETTPDHSTMLVSARVGSVHQETYLGPVTPQSPVQQVVERIVDELDPGLQKSAAPSSDQLQQTGTQAVKVLHLQLSPANFGPLTIRMTLRHDALELQVEASNQETAKLIDNDRETLFGLLRSAGYAVDVLTVQTATRTDGSSMNTGSGAFPQSSGQAQAGSQQSQGRGGGQAAQGDNRGGEAIGGNGKDGSDSRTSRTAGGAVYL